MTRARPSAKDAGARFERQISDYLSWRLKDDRIDRRVRNGAKDRGDIGGLRTPLGDRIVLEAKNYGGRILAGPWITEAQIEAGNDDAPIGVVCAKRRGTTDPAEQFVLMTLADFATLLGGEKLADELTPDVLAILCAERARLRAQIEQLQEVVDGIDAQLRTLPEGSHDAGDYTVQVQVSHRLNATRFVRAYPAEARPDLYQLTPDLTQVRRRISEVDLLPYMDESRRLVVK